MQKINTGSQKFINTRKAIERFVLEYNREPELNDFNIVDYLPSVRTIQRSFGGVKLLRETLGLKKTMYRSLSLKSKKGTEVNIRSQKYEKEIYEILYKKYHDINSIKFTVERELEYARYGKETPTTKAIRSDVAIVNRQNNHIIFFDFFYPSTITTFKGCVRIKRNKIRKHMPDLSAYTYEHIFVCINPEFTQDQIDLFKMDIKGFELQSFDTFKQKFF